jgi:hypothetical protein
MRFADTAVIVVGDDVEDSLSIDTNEEMFDFIMLLYLESAKYSVWSF